MEEPPDNSPPRSSVTNRTLHRHLSFWNSLTLGFAMVSPVVGLYAIMGAQTAVTGGGWFVALAICLIMQLLVATVYAELASQFPIAGGAYKWAHHLGGPITGQFAGVIYVTSTIAMLTTTAAISPDAPWWQLWAVPLVLGSILGITTLHVLIRIIRRPTLPESSSR